MNDTHDFILVGAGSAGAAPARHRSVGALPRLAPNHSSENGAQAIGGTFRNALNNGVNNPPARRDCPMRSPNGTPTARASRKPERKRRTLQPA